MEEREDHEEEVGLDRLLFGNKDSTMYSVDCPDGAVSIGWHKIIPNDES